MIYLECSFFQKFEKILLKLIWNQKVGGIEFLKIVSWIQSQDSDVKLTGLYRTATYHINKYKSNI